MKYIIVPPSVVLQDRTGNPIRDQAGATVPPITMYSFLMDVPCSDPRIGVGGMALRRINKIDRLFATAPPGAEVGVEDSDYAAVTEVLNQVVWASPITARQQMPFIDAWENATGESRKPETV